MKYFSAYRPFPEGITKAKSNPITKMEQKSTKSKAVAKYFQSFLFIENPAKFGHLPSLGSRFSKMGQTMSVSLARRLALHLDH
jgi:hypothetical protein